MSSIINTSFAMHIKLHSKYLPFVSIDPYTSALTFTSTGHCCILPDDYQSYVLVKA